MKTLITICSWEHPEYLAYMLEPDSQFWDMGVRADVLIVNNGSTSSIYYATLDAFKNRAIIETRENSGRELGAFNYAERKYNMYNRYMFLQHDVVFKRTPWLSPFVSKFDETPNCGAVGFCVRRVASNPGDACHRATGVTGYECEEILLEKFGAKYKFDSFCGGSILYTSRNVLDNLRNYGGIYWVDTPETTPGFENTKEFHTLFTSERLFGAMIENMGYEIVEMPGTIYNGYEHR